MEGAKLFIVSKQMESFHRSSAMTQKNYDKDTVYDTTSTGVDSVFSTISPEILGTFENEIIE